MNKFAKYVPEEDKKKQREHIGAVGASDLPFGETSNLVTDIVMTEDYSLSVKLTGANVFETYTLTIGDQVFGNLSWHYHPMSGGPAFYHLGAESDMWSSEEYPFMLAVFEMEIEENGDIPASVPCGLSISDDIYDLVGGETPDDFINNFKGMFEIVHIKTLDPKYLPGASVVYVGGTMYTDDSGNPTIELDELVADVHRKVVDGFEVVLRLVNPEIGDGPEVFARVGLHDSNVTLFYAFMNMMSSFVVIPIQINADNDTNTATTFTLEF